MRTFAVDLFIAPSEEKITVLKKYNTEHKGKTQKMKLKSQNTDMYEHRTQNICTQNTICITEAYMCHCVSFTDVLYPVFITCDFCVWTFEFYVVSFPF